MQRCTATSRRSGKQCGNWAMHYQTVCRMHGGSAPQARRAAHRRAQEAAAEAELSHLALTAAPDVDPGEALIRSVAASYAMCQHLRAIVEDLPADGLTEYEYVGEGGRRHVTAAEVDLLHTWETLHARVCLGALKAGVDERRIRLAEAQASTIVAVLRAALTDLGHDPADTHVGQVVARHLRLVQGDTA